MEKKYVPINCDYYDELELWAMRKTNVRIVYLNVEDEHQTVEGVIKNLFAKNKVEYLLLEDGFLLRLDQLISVNDKPLPTSC